MAEDIIRLAEFEGFPAHADSIRIRFGMKKEAEEKPKRDKKRNRESGERA